MLSLKRQKQVVSQQRGESASAIKRRVSSLRLVVIVGPAKLSETHETDYEADDILVLHHTTPFSHGENMCACVNEREKEKERERKCNYNIFMNKNPGKNKHD